MGRYVGRVYRIGLEMAGVLWNWEFRFRESALGAVVRRGGRARTEMVMATVVAMFSPGPGENDRAAR